MTPEEMNSLCDLYINAAHPLGDIARYAKNLGAENSELQKYYKVFKDYGFRIQRIKEADRPERLVFISVEGSPAEENEKRTDQIINENIDLAGQVEKLKLAVESEREACAVIADEDSKLEHIDSSFAARAIAMKIRHRVSPSREVQG